MYGGGDFRADPILEARKNSTQSHCGKTPFSIPKENFFNTLQ